MRIWSRFSYEKLQKSEDSLIRSSGTSIISKHIDLGNNTFLYVQYCGNPSLPPLILLHGYCGASMIYYKILLRLSERFYILMIDLIGMGRSSRPSFSYTRIDDCENFFTNCLEKFREIENIKKFVIVGHSFGGYVAGCYAIMYPQYVEKVVLLSPIGVSDPPPNWDYVEYLKRQNWKVRWIMMFLSFFWVKNITPVSILRKTGPFSQKLMKVYSSHKLARLGDDKDSMETYLEQINLLPGSGEHALIYLLNPGGVAIKPLWRRLGKVTVPIIFIYGDRDWIKPDGAEQAASIYNNVSIRFVQDSGHDLYWDNPEHLVYLIFEGIDQS